MQRLIHRSGTWSRGRARVCLDIAVRNLPRESQPQAST